MPIQANLPPSFAKKSSRGNLIVSNVARALSPYLKIADKENPRITIEVVNTSQPDVVDICYPEMELNTVSWDANTVDTSIVSTVSTSEPMPWLRFNLANFPNMQE